jgi:hypothetical protein
MQGHRRPLLLNGRDHLCMRDGFGCLDTTDGTGAGISGCVETGSTRLGGGLCGFPAVGCLAAGAMSTSPDLGVNALNCSASAFTRDRHAHEAISTALPGPGDSSTGFSEGQREPSCELKRVLLVSDLGIIQEVINRRYRKGELLVDGQSQRAGAGGGEGTGVIPGYVG